jgi:hypothetical protein
MLWRREGMQNYISSLLKCIRRREGEGWSAVEKRRRRRRGRRGDGGGTGEEAILHRRGHH